jgi:hypothetical protein
VNANLREFCLNRLGFDPADLSEQELSARVPEIEQAIAERVEICKSAILVAASNRLEFLNSISESQEEV